METPEDTLSSYKSVYNGNKGESVYNLMSSEFKSKNTEDDVVNMVYAARIVNNLKIEEFKILDKWSTGENSGICKVEITYKYGGYQFTETEEIEFVHENDGWKLTDLLF